MEDWVESSATAAIHNATMDPSEGISADLSIADLGEADLKFHRRIQDSARRNDINSAQC